MKKFSWMLAALFVALVAILLWRTDPARLIGLPYQANMALVGVNVIGALLVVTLIVERSMAVVNALLFGEDERQAELERMHAVQGSGSTIAADEKIKKVMDAKSRVRLLLSFAAGLFVSAAGVRTLAGLLNIGTTGSANILLLPVDIVLTAGLIAGGSQSLAFLAQVLKDLAAPPPEAETPANGDNGNNGNAVQNDAFTSTPAPPRGRPARNLRARLV